MSRTRRDAKRLSKKSWSKPVPWTNKGGDANSSSISCRKNLYVGTLVPRRIHGRKQKREEGIPPKNEDPREIVTCRESQFDWASMSPLAIGNEVPEKRGGRNEEVGE